MPKHRYLAGLDIPKDFITFGFQTIYKLLELEGALRERAEIGIQRSPKILHMSHHLKVKESLGNKVSSMYHAMNTQHERCMLVDKMYYNTKFYTLKGRNPICHECDQPLPNILVK